MKPKKKERATPIRMLNRDGELNVEKDTIGSFVLYDHLIAISWQRFLFYALAAYVIINIIFSLAYFSSGGLACLRNVKDYTSVFREFLDIFFFSTQTFTTVGYGYVHPICLATNFIASFESFSGLIFFSVVTGLFYAKFTKPRVEVRLSEVAVIESFQEGYGLKFMIANEYKNKLVDVEVTLDLIRLEQADDRLKKRFYQCFLFRKKIPFLSVPWTVVHIIDENSPLKGLSRQDLETENLEFFVQVKAFDEEHGQTIYKEFSYFGASEVLWGHRFANIQRYTQTGALKLNMQRFGKPIPIEDFPDVI